MGGELLETTLDRGIKQGLAQGRAEGHIATIVDSTRNLMETLHLTVEQAMDALKIPPEQRAEYAARLNASSQ